MIVHIRAVVPIVGARHEFAPHRLRDSLWSQRRVGGMEVLVQRQQIAEIARLKLPYTHVSSNAAHQRQGKVARTLRFAKCVTL